MRYKISQVTGWNIPLIFQKIKSIDIAAFDWRHPDVLHPRLRVILKLSKSLKQDIKLTHQKSFHPNRKDSRTTVPGIKKTLHRSVKTAFLSNTLSSAPSRTPSRSPSAEPTGDTEQGSTGGKNGCSRCSALPPQDRCRWYIEVQERGISDITGCVLSCTEDPTERLPPLVMYICCLQRALPIYRKRNGKTPPKPLYTRPQRNWDSPNLRTDHKFLKDVAATQSFSLIKHQGHW